MALSIKAGVKLTGIQPEMAIAAQVVDGVLAEYGHDTVITSALDGQHMQGSLHYAGLALDFRTRDIAPEQQQQLTAIIRERLGADYDVVLETDHLHVEMDAKVPPTV